MPSVELQYTNRIHTRNVNLKMTAKKRRARQAIFASDSLESDKENHVIYCKKECGRISLECNKRSCSSSSTCSSSSSEDSTVIPIQCKLILCQSSCNNVYAIYSSIFVYCSVFTLVLLIYYNTFNAQFAYDDQ